MIKRIILTVILLGIVIGINTMIADSYRLVVQDRLAVSQLEDSDLNVVALNSSTRMMKFMPWISFFIVSGLLYFIWGNYVKKKYNEITTENKKE